MFSINTCPSNFDWHLLHFIETNSIMTSTKFACMCVCYRNVRNELDIELREMCLLSGCNCIKTLCSLNYFIKIELNREGKRERERVEVNDVQFSIGN